MITIRDKALVQQQIALARVRAEFIADCVKTILAGKPDDVEINDRTIQCLTAVAEEAAMKEITKDNYLKYERPRGLDDE